MRAIAGIIFVVGFIWLVGIPFLGVMLFLWILGGLANFALGGKDK